MTLHSDNTRMGADFLAKRSERNPRQIIVSLIEQNPDASKDKLFDLFRKQVEDDEDCARAVQWYFFVNMYEYMVTSRNRKPSQTMAAQAARAAQVSEIKRRILGLSLDFTMPNGRPLRECTGADCAEAGGFLSKIARKVGPRTKVGAVFQTDEALQKWLK